MGILQHPNIDRSALADYRKTHPLEKQLNHAATMHLWPKATHGQFRAGPVRGAHAELFDSHHHQHKASHAATAQINITLANGTVSTHGVNKHDLRAASRYVTTLNAYAQQLQAEDDEA